MLKAMNEFEKCVKEKKLVEIEASKEMIEKEIKDAEFDLLRARNSFEENDYKWTMVQAYYSMFHASKALILMKGYREKSHYCLVIALKELYVKSGVLDTDLVDDFEINMELRHQADYGLDYDEESAKLSLEKAEHFHNVVKEHF